MFSPLRMLLHITSLFAITVILLATTSSAPVNKEIKAPSFRALVHTYYSPGELVEGDIRIPRSLWRRNAVLSPNSRWPSGEVPYQISNDFPSSMQANIRTAMQEIAEKTCVTFREKTNDDIDYVRIEFWMECSSDIGRLGGEQYISLGIGCEDIGTILHELIHTLGFWHEHSRWDRDDHVYVDYDNIDITKIRNFAIYPKEVATTLGEQYDYDSIMHYGAYEYAVDVDVPTITTIPNPDDISRLGQRTGLSQLDIVKLNKYYSC